MRSITSKQGSLVIGRVALKNDITDIKEHWLNAKIHSFIIMEVSSIKSQTCLYFEGVSCGSPSLSTCIMAAHTIL